MYILTIHKKSYNYYYINTLGFYLSLMNSGEIGVNHKNISYSHDNYHHERK